MTNINDAELSGVVDGETVFIRWRNFDEYLASGFVIPISFDSLPGPRTVAINTPGVEDEAPGQLESAGPQLFDGPSLTANPVAPLVTGVTTPANDVWQAIWFPGATTATFVLACHAGMLFQGF